MARKSTELRPIMTRLPEGLRAKLEREASKNERSMNAEVIHRLNYSFAAEHNAATQDDVIRQLIKERDRAADRVAEIEDLLANIKNDMKLAVRETLAEAGMLKGSAR